MNIFEAMLIAMIMKDDSNDNSPKQTEMGIHKSTAIMVGWLAAGFAVAISLWLLIVLNIK